MKSHMLVVGVLQVANTLAASRDIARALSLILSLRLYFKMRLPVCLFSSPFAEVDSCLLLLRAH